MDDRRERFVLEYLKDLNGTQAAIRAGYAESGARTQASRLLADDNISDAIAAGKAKAAANLEITAERVLAELAKLAFSNSTDFVNADGTGIPLGDLDRDKMAAVSEITFETYTEGRGEAAETLKRSKVKLYDKRAALNDLGRHLKLFTDKVQVSGEIGITISEDDAKL